MWQKLCYATAYLSKEENTNIYIYMCISVSNITNNGRNNQFFKNCYFQSGRNRGRKC